MQQTNYLSTETMKPVLTDVLLDKPWSVTSDDWPPGSIPLTYKAGVIFDVASGGEEFHKCGEERSIIDSHRSYEGIHTYEERGGIKAEKDNGFIKCDSSLDGLFDKLFAYKGAGLIDQNKNGQNYSGPFHPSDPIGPIEYHLGVIFDVASGGEDGAQKCGEEWRTIIEFNGGSDAIYAWTDRSGMKAEGWVDGPKLKSADESGYWPPGSIPLTSWPVDPGPKPVMKAEKSM